MIITKYRSGSEVKLPFLATKRLLINQNSEVCYVMLRSRATLNKMSETDFCILRQIFNTKANLTATGFVRNNLKRDVRLQLSDFCCP